MSFQKITNLEKSGFLKLVEKTLHQHLDTEFAQPTLKMGKKHIRTMYQL